MNKPSAYTFTTTLLIALSLIGPAFGQAPAAGQAEADAIKALTNEVRLLRETLEVYARNQLRSEVLIQRARSQYEQVAMQTQRLEDTRMELANLHAGMQQSKAKLDSVEAQLQKASTVDQRTDLENTHRELQVAQQQETERDAELRERENQQMLALRASQAQLDDINREVDSVYAGIPQPTPVTKAPPLR